MIWKRDVGALDSTTAELDIVLCRSYAATKLNIKYNASRCWPWLFRSLHEKELDAGKVVDDGGVERPLRYSADFVNAMASIIANCNLVKCKCLMLITKPFVVFLLLAFDEDIYMVIKVHRILNILI